VARHRFGFLLPSIQSGVEPLHSIKGRENTFRDSLTFRLSLAPALPTPLPSGIAEVERTAMTTEAGSLLIVDDNLASCELLARSFRQRGYTVTVGRDGDQALALLRAGNFDLILLDITMPGTNGFNVLQAVRADYPAVVLPVIMVTAHDRSDDIVRALELGANDYVVKPYDFPVVFARARIQLALKRTVEQKTQLELSLAQRNEELAVVNHRLGAAYQRTKRDLRAAARIQESLLPRTPPAVPGARFAWGFQPCEELAGDTLNIVPLDPDHVGLYLLDVSGHGVAAALLSVTLSQLLTATREDSSVLVRNCPDSPEDMIVPPAEVAAHLNRRFPWNPDTEQYFTLTYGILDHRTGDFRFVCAGHPGPLYVPPDGRPTFLEWPSLPVGIGEGRYQERTLRLEPGGRLYLYSDGITDVTNAAAEVFGKPRLLARLAASRDVPLDASIDAVLRDVHAWCGTPRPRDDVSILGVEFTGAGSRPAAAESPRVAAGVGS
jgi:sigma-B regulation protein RsbU (phosphoserine phosphatase)